MTDAPSLILGAKLWEKGKAACDEGSTIVEGSSPREAESRVVGGAGTSHTA
jgi:hypothetical protein